MKNLKKLGKVLGKKEQKSINGGSPGHCTMYDCYNPYTRVWTCVPSCHSCHYPVNDLC